MSTPEAHALTALKAEVGEFEAANEARQIKFGNAIRTICQSQHEVWQQIPLLALQADGRTGYSFENLILFERGLLRVKGVAEFGGYSTYVDCLDGNIVDVEDDLAKTEPTPDIKVYDLLDMVDAQATLSKYQAKAAKPYGEYYYSDYARERGIHPDQAEADKEEKIRILGLTTPYNRPDDMEDRITATRHLYPEYAGDFSD